MTVDEIKKAVDEGKIVRWSNELYLVHKKEDSYLITCEPNGHTIGLTWFDGVTLNGKEEEFYVEVNKWDRYLDYLKNWAETHSEIAYEGMSPACYDEFCENDDVEE